MFICTTFFSCNTQFSPKTASQTESFTSKQVAGLVFDLAITIIFAIAPLFISDVGVWKWVLLSGAGTLMVINGTLLCVMLFKRKPTEAEALPSEVISTPRVVTHIGEQGAPRPPHPHVSLNQAQMHTPSRVQIISSAPSSEPEDLPRGGPQPQVKPSPPVTISSVPSSEPEDPPTGVPQPQVKTPPPPKHYPDTLYLKTQALAKTYAIKFNEEQTLEEVLLPICIENGVTLKDIRILFAGKKLDITSHLKERASLWLEKVRVLNVTTLHLIFTAETKQVAEPSELEPQKSLPVSFKDFLRG